MNYAEPIGALILLITVVFLIKQSIREKISNFLGIVITLLLWLSLEIGWIEKNLISIFVISALTLVISTTWRIFDIHCDWSLKKADLKIIGRMFLITMAVVIPLAFGLGMVHFSVTELWLQHPWTLAIILPMFFFAKALPEELIFRGIIQNLLIKRLSPFWAIMLSALFFGLTRINDPEWLAPNWHGMIVASVIGLSCGIVYWKSRSLLSAALLHFLIDIAWWGLLI